MKFTCEKTSILKEISIAQEIISSRNALSILSNVLLDCSQNALTIRATDLKVSFETRIPVDVTVPGSTTVFCDKLLGIVRSLPEGEVEFSLEADDRLVIQPLFKKINFQLKSIAAEKFPEIQSISEDQYFEIPQRDFVEMVTQTIFAVSDDETRYFMNGVYLENSDGELAMVATDGRRLSFIRRGIESPLPDFQGVIVPPKILNLVAKLASGEGVIQLAVTDKNIFAQFDSKRVSSTLIEGQFPHYRRVIPEQQEHQSFVNRVELLEALRRVSLLVEQKSRRIYVTLGADAITLNSEESDIGVAKEEIPCRFDGPESTIGLNYLYLLEPLRVMKADEVLIQFSEPNKAVTLHPVPEADFFHVVMPMQID